MDALLIRRWDLVLPAWFWLLEPRVGVPSTWRAVSTRGTTVFVSGLLELLMDRRISDLGMGRYPPRVALILRTSDRGFHTVRDGIDLDGPPFSSPGCWSCRYIE